jgi:hypothetical protein
MGSKVRPFSRSDLKFFQNVAGYFCYLKLAIAILLKVYFIMSLYNKTIITWSCTTLGIIIVLRRDYF